jgi:predicted lipoprotein with Yx(FWY)xxD motif
MKRVLLLATLATIAIGAQANPTVERNGVLANKEGRTLYTFDKDAPGKSNCYGGCAAAWPPFAVANPALAGGDFTIVARDDGTAQWAYKGKPLYFFAGDAKPGDINGDKQGGVWHVIRTAPAKTSSSDDAYGQRYSYTY